MFELEATTLILIKNVMTYLSQFLKDPNRHFFKRLFKNVNLKKF